LLERYRPQPGDADRDTVIGETALVLEDIPIDGVGRAVLRGSTWRARNVGESPVIAKQRCRVERIDGLMLWIRGQ
jgi:inner membrane protein